MPLDTRLVPGAGPARRDLALAVLLGALAGALLVWQSALLSRALDAVFLGGAGPGDLQGWLGPFVAVALGRAGAAWLGDVASARAAARVRVDLRRALLRRIGELGPRFVGAERTGELTHTLVDGVEATDAYVSQYAPQLALAVVVPVLVAVAVARADLLSAAVLVLTYPLIPLFMYLVGGVARERTRRQWVTLSRMGARFLDAVQGLATLKAFGRASDEAAAVASASERYRIVTMGVLRMALLSALTLELLATLGTAIVAVEVGLRLLAGRIAFEPAIFALILAPEFYRPLRTLGASFHAGMAGREASGRIGQILAAPAESGAPPASAKASGPAALDTPFGVTFDDVHFTYGAGLPPALEGVSFTVGAGEAVALVGPSGAGKTTVAQLLLGFLRPERGAILAGERRLTELDPRAWRRLVTWVPQRPHLFHGTVADNLRIARPEATREDLERALRRACADGFVEALPQGLDTPIGEQGQRLSGGQAQRLALARALLRDAPLVVLDEPTSQLDPEHEARVAAAIAALRRERTVLLIAHRLGTAGAADRVVMLAGGRVVEQGRHAELLASGGVYARLIAAWHGVS